MKRPTPIRSRLTAKIRVDSSGCWVFTGSTGTHGYGRIYDHDHGKPVQAHRVAYELFIGPVPEGLQLDHLCRRRACVNPAHLEPVTSRENTMRGLVPLTNGQHNRLKTHCPADHQYDLLNTRFTAQGWRYCHTCKREQSATNYRKARAA